VCYLSDRKEAFNCNVDEFHASRVEVQCEYFLLYLFVTFPRYTVFLSSTSITSCKVSAVSICVDV
jgi:NADH:ubiquinone oxidoreductase subunit 3 (subunit A)